MRSFLRIFLVVWLIMAVGVAAITAAMYVAVRNAGFGSVAVYDRHEGVSVTVPVPALPVHIAASVLGSVPVRVHWNHGDVPEIGESFVALLDEVAAGPDATLVEITEHGDRVRVAKNGDQIVISVDDGHDRVRVTVPIRTARKVAHALR